MFLHAAARCAFGARVITPMHRPKHAQSTGHKVLAYLCYGDSATHWLELRASLLSAF